MKTTMPAVTLPNVADGPDQFDLEETAARDNIDAVVSSSSTTTMRPVSETGEDGRRSVRRVRGRRRGGGVGPPRTDRAGGGVADQCDLPFPLLAAPSKRVSEGFDQPTRFGRLGSLHDLVGRMPLAVVLDVCDGEPVIAVVHEGSTPGDRPDVDELLAAAEDLDSAGF